MFVPKVKRFLETPFGMGRGFMQGNPVSPIIFNIMVDAVVKETLEVFCGPQEARYGMGWAAGKHNLIFYVDSRIIGGREYHI